MYNCYMTSTFHLEEVHGLDAVENRVVVKTQLKVWRSPRLKLHLLAKLALDIRDSADQR